MTMDKNLRRGLLTTKKEFQMSSLEASHQGSVWECMIRSVRVVLNDMAAKHKGRIGTQTLKVDLQQNSNYSYLVSKDSPCFTLLCCKRQICRNVITSS